MIAERDRDICGGCTGTIFVGKRILLLLLAIPDR
jgi:hypothetical protein